MTATKNIICKIRMSLAPVSHPIINNSKISLWSVRENQTKSESHEKSGIKNQNGYKSEVEVQLQIFHIKESLKQVLLSSMKTIY